MNLIKFSFDVKYSGSSFFSLIYQYLIISNDTMEAATKIQQLRSCTLDEYFVLTAECLLKLTQNAKSVFESLQPAKKNKILRALLAN